MTKKTVSHGPRSIDLTLVQEWQDGRVRRFQDDLVGEEPLEIRVGKHALSVTMRTPGHDLELAAGFLYTEGLIHRREEIAAIDYAEDGKPTERGNVVQIELASAASLDLERTRRNFFAVSSCGICGKASIESVRVRNILRPNPQFRLDPQVLCRLPETLRRRSSGARVGFTPRVCSTRVANW